jgi:hypothetical protein
MENNFTATPVKRLPSKTSVVLSKQSIRQWPAVKTNNQKGGYYVVDNCCDTDNSVVAGAGEQLHDWRFDSHPAGNRNYHCAGQSHSGAEAYLEKSILMLKKNLFTVIFLR